MSKKKWKHAGGDVEMCPVDDPQQCWEQKGHGGPHCSFFGTEFTHGTITSDDRRASKRKTGGA